MNVWYFIIGSTAGLIFWLFDKYQYQKLLILKSELKYRTAEKIGKTFYFIVPENEYIEMESYWLVKKWDDYYGSKE